MVYGSRARGPAVPEPELARGWARFGGDMPLHTGDRAAGQQPGTAWDNDIHGITCLCLLSSGALGGQ